MACQIVVRVTTRSSKPGIGGWRKDSDGRNELELRVTEAPADGAANAAVTRLIADALDIPRSQVSLVAGQSSRYKRVALPLEFDEVRRRIEENSA